MDIKSGLVQHEVEQIMRELSFLCELFLRVCTISCWKWDFNTSCQSYCSCIKNKNNTPFFKSQYNKDQHTNRTTGCWVFEGWWDRAVQHIFDDLSTRGRGLPLAQLSTGSQSRERMICRWFLPDPCAQIWQPEKETKGKNQETAFSYLRRGLLLTD